MSLLKALLNVTHNINLQIGLRPVMPNILPVRNAAKRVKRNTRQRRKAPGVKRCDGDCVRQGEIIVTQFRLHFHPGLNVAINNKNTLTAMRDGQLLMTCETINPKKEAYIAQKYYSNIAAPVVYKRFFHVVPFKQGQKFKLINLV